MKRALLHIGLIVAGAFILLGSVLLGAVWGVIVTTFAALNILHDAWRQA